MQEVSKNRESDASPTAASLNRIQVRKSKSSLLDTTKKKKAGDITDRLTVLSAELDLQSNADTDITVPAIVDEVPQAPVIKPAEKTEAERPSTRRNYHSDVRLSEEEETDHHMVKPATTDILEYWMQIRNGRRYPSWQSLDADVVGVNWPNCILVHVNKDVGRLQVKYEFTTAVRKAAQKVAPLEDIIAGIEFTPMIIDWIISQGRDVAASGKPSHDTDYFPTLTGEIPLRVIALPLSEGARAVDHVLCYVQKLS
jgi:hypothetical protein